MTQKMSPSPIAVQFPMHQLKRLAAAIRLALAGGIIAGYLEQGHAAPPALSILPVPAGKDFVKFGKADIGIKGSAMNIRQHTDKAILHWNSFNIGTKNQVNFQQPKATSIALNRILQNNPSQILGQLNANGQVYLVNQNGFVFGKNASVNVHTLVASTLDIKDEVFKGAGITKVVNETDTATGAKKAALDGTHAGSSISIENGAKISAADGGRLILSAPQINNSGDLNAGKSGQIILVASEDKVYLSETNPASSSGLLVEVGSGGKVTNKNLGNITTRQGNVTLAGFAVNQEGRVSATTSSRVNGSIRLQAREGIDEAQPELRPKASGTVRYDSSGEPNDKANVTLGVGSLTQIGIDKDDAKSVDEQAQPQSTIAVSANTIHLKQNAAIQAPGAKVDMTASGNPIDFTQGEQGADGTSKPLDGKIILDSGAKIDVSGAKNITASVSRNIVDVPVQSFELRNAPLQKGGVLQGKTIKVDIRHKPVIVDASGAEKRIERSTEERLARQLKGQVNLTAAGQISVNPGAKIDISGGKVSYQGGNVETTKLMTDNGKIVDISEADPNLHYRSVLGAYEEVHQKWGITKVWQSGLAPGQSAYEPGYWEGLGAGELNIHTPKLFWQGDLLAGSVGGRYQREDSPYGGKWAINEDLTTSNYNASRGDEFSFIPRQNIHIQGSTNQLHIASGTGQPNSGDLVLDNDMINRSGVQELTAKTAGSAKIDSDANLNLPAKGNFDLVARNIDFAGKVHSAGGNVSLAAGWNQSDKTDGLDPVSLFGNVSSPMAASDGQLTLNDGSSINVSGRWVNDKAITLSGELPTEPFAVEGGKVSLTSGIAGIDLQAGSVIKADGGARLTEQQILKAGEGGKIEFETHRAANIGEAATVYPGLKLNGTLSAYGLTQGGELAISHDTDHLFIGKPDANDPAENRFVLPVALNNLKLQGINSFSHLAIENPGLDIALTRSTVLDLKQQNYSLAENYQQFDSGDSLSPFSSIVTLPDYLRNPVDLTLSPNHNLKLETGSKILADPNAVISLTAAGTDGSLFIDGLVSAPGGIISANSKQDVDTGSYYPHHIWLGSHSVLDVAGTAVLKPLDSLGRQVGEVLAGGTVNLLAGAFDKTTAAGHVIIEKGAKINAAGAQATLDLPDGNSDGGRTSPQVVGSNGGNINIRASESIVLDGDLYAKAGSPGTLGGHLNVQFVDYLPVGVNAHAHEMTISQSYHRQLDAGVAFDDLLSSPKFFDPSLGLVGTARLSADQIQAGGFSDLSLFVNSSGISGDQDLSDPSNAGSVTFLGDVKMKVGRRIALDAPKMAWSSPVENSPGHVTLDTAFLRAGSSLAYQVQSPTLAGKGQFTANTQWMEFNGASSWSGFSTLNFNNRHDVRTVSHYLTENDGFETKLNTSGDINLVASQVYPTTLSNFSFNIDAATNPEGRISVAKSGLIDETPLTAGGMLDFNAPVIRQNGTVKAPFGKISLTATQSLVLGKDSLTSVSGAGVQVPFGNILNGQNWVYPGRINGNGGDNDKLELISSPPEKKLTLNAPDIVLEKGSSVDLSGGGDLLAAEFQPGIGGEFNYLGNFKTSDKDIDNPAYQGGFAILPGFNSALAPSDPLQKNLGNYRYETGQQIYLNGSGKLAAGYYTILPARYALMPGGLLVTPQADTQDQRVNGFTASGLPVVGGYLTDAGTGAKEQRWSGYQIEDGKDVRLHSQYDERSANAFFTQKATKDQKPVPILPEDSGQIVIKGAQSKLVLEGGFNVKPDQKGRGAKMDIAGEQINIVSKLDAGTANNGLQIVADSLSHLGVGSLFLGGERSIDPETGATHLAVSAKQVTIGNGATLTGTDLIVAAQEKVSVLSGAKLQADGQVNTGDKTLNITNVGSDPNQPLTSNDGALLRLSADNQVRLNRTNAPGDSGELNIESGAHLSANNSVLLDASGNTSLAGDIAMKGGSLNLSANTVNLGEVDSLSASGVLNLSNNDLAKLAVDEFVLSSRGSLNLYGNVGLKDKSGHYQPLDFEKLVIKAVGINGFGNAGNLAQLAAKDLQIENSSGSALAQTGTGKGQLKLAADNYSQGSGMFGLSGFSLVGIHAANAFKASSNGILDVAGNLNVTAGYLTSAPGASLSINAGGVASFNSSSAKSTLPTVEDLGGTLKINAAAIDFGTTAILPSGTLDLHSTTGNTQINGNAHIDLAGRRVVFGDTADYTPGGKFKAASDKGGVLVAKGAAIDIRSGGGAESGGKLDFQVAGSLQLDGGLKAQGGSADLDVGGFAENASFDTLMDKLMAAGVSDALSVRARQGNIQQENGHIIKANAIKLAADKGDVLIDGTLGADGKSGGGSVELYAGDRINLRKDAVVSAQGTGAGTKGGTMVFAATDTDHDGNGGIAIDAGAQIDTSGGSRGIGGQVVLRAQRKGQDGIDIDKINGNINGVSQFYAEGVKIYSNADLGNDGSIDAADIDKIKSDTAGYMSPATIAKIGNALGKGIQLRPGVEIDYQGDLALKDEWDLLDWRYPAGANNAAGSLGIRASGNLTFNNSLTDGFKTSALPPIVKDVLDATGLPTGQLLSITPYMDTLQAGNTWNYRLTAGADLNASDDGQIGNESGNLLIAQKNGASDLNPLDQHTNLLHTVIRTGLGNIQLAASGDIAFGEGKVLNAAGESILNPADFYIDPISGVPVNKPFFYSTSVYTAGTPETQGGAYGADPLTTNGYVDYPHVGGNLVLNAGHDIKGSLYQEPTIKNWLVVQGLTTQTDEFGNPLPNSPTTWGVDFAKFGQNVGAFGGGHVAVRAGGSIDDLTVMAPTTGRQVSASKVQTNGSDDLNVVADGNINGGIYLLGHGQTSLAAGGVIGGTRNQAKDLNPDATALDSMLDLTGGPQLELGDTATVLRAGQGIAITGVNDPILMDTDGTTKFFTGSSLSSLSLKSLAGNIALASDASVAGSATTDSYYPASLSVTAFGGNILKNPSLQGGGQLKSSPLLLPSAIGKLTMLAKYNIDAAVAMSDYAAGFLPTPLNPVSVISDTSLNGINPISVTPDGTENPHAKIPVHEGDQDPARLFARFGDIAGNYYFPKKALISAGRDIKGFSLAVQHANPKGDVSIISVGRDINFNGDPFVTDGSLAASGEIKVGGTGNVFVTAGRNIDLSVSNGIMTNGNQDNPNLYDAGANLTVIAGLQGTQPDYLSFEKLDGRVLDYAENYNQYQDKVVELMRNRTGNTKMTAKTAFEQFEQLSPAEKAAFNYSNRGLLSNRYRKVINEIKQTIVQFVRTKENNPRYSEELALDHFRQLKLGEYLPVQAKLDNLASSLLMSELNATGSASAADPTVGNKRGYDAINALFPDAHWQGDIGLAFSQIKTENGGNINLLAPGGNIDVGLPVPGVDKSSDQLGVIARDTGDVNIFLDGDLNVNQSRVFALGGGDITVWSSHGDIDAGRGAKSAFAVADPSYQFDADGNLVVDFRAPVAGSGIRTVAPPSGNGTAGNVGLYAPGGVVNAAEAGIGGNNVTISATAVLGAGNIQVGGVATGVPASSAVSLAAGLNGASNVAANATQAAEASANMNKDRMDDAKNGSQKQLGTISVEIIGFGA